MRSPGLMCPRPQAEQQPGYFASKAMIIPQSPLPPFPYPFPPPPGLTLAAVLGAVKVAGEAVSSVEDVLQLHTLARLRQCATV